ncbi:hypothetical protein ELQ35_09825 [Peribacillus cavernae]|uniref:Uncharacterized protein n=1 Tax=Peribacillus cavernae TaxID=1674310 RepID=A0A3S0VKC8_9BACI|nr:hypothetical protein ELQ35_09825 [Peribacillus cavernae]
MIVQRTFACSVTACVPHFYQTSQGKHTFFLSMSPLHLLYAPFGSKGFDLFRSLTQAHLALYEVRVPKGGDLPLTSF